jgi:type II secretory pathway component PulF
MELVISIFACVILLVFISVLWARGIDYMDKNTQTIKVTIYLTKKKMAKYLKTAFVRDLEILVQAEGISYGRMLELIQEEVIKNYKQDIKQNNI